MGMTRRKRIVLGVIFVVSLMICGLVVGTWVGGRVFVPPGSGLAGPAIALGYGLLGAGISGLAAFVLSIYLSPGRLLGIVLPVGVVGAVLAVLLGNAHLASRSESAAFLEKAYTELNAFRVTLVDAGAPFQRLEADWNSRRYTAVANGKTCSATLSGKEAVALLSALRSVGGVVLKDAYPCAGTPGAAEREIEWYIPEHLPPDTAGKLAITDACASRFPELNEPFDAAARIFRHGDHRKECR